MVIEASPGHTMTSRQRVLRFLARQPVDRRPCFSGMGNVTLAGIEAHDWDFASLHTDAEKMATAAASTAKLFGFDCAVVPFATTVEAEALGCEVNYYEGLTEDPDEIYYPTVKTKHVETATDIRLPAGGPEKAGRIPLVVDAIHRLKVEFGDDVPVGAWVLGPFTLAGQIVELDKLLRMPVTAVPELRKILDVLADFLIGVLHLYRAAGADYLTIREPGAASNVISPRLFRELVLPRLQRIFAQIESPKILHICGRTNEIITAMSDAGADALSVDHSNDVRASREAIGGEVMLLGNFDAYRLLLEETPECVAKTITESLDSGLNTVWPGCDIWPAARPENLRAVVAATHAYPPDTLAGT
jgi:[methyl-Co(III) methanol-specific corrinoid protein]:coenzyme M methyltransferase